MADQAAITVYTFPYSGHAHRVELFLHLIDLPYERHLIDLRAGEHRQPAFLHLNPFGQVPVLRDGDLILADSNAILVYLAKRYAGAQWLPDDAVGAARIQRWLSVAAGELVQGPALARLLSNNFRSGDPAPHRERARVLLGLMEAQLTGSDFLAGEHCTIADVALYTYIAVAPEGGVALEDYPAVRAWLSRIEALPRFLPMLRLPVAAAG